MSKLIPLLLVLVYSFSHSSGHHRGQEDIELSPSIMRFLTKIKKNIKDDSDVTYFDDDLEETIPLKNLSFPIEQYMSEENETKHNNTPVENIDDKKSKDVKKS